MNKRMKKDELLKLIESLKIDKNEFWILSSGARRSSLVSTVAGIYWPVIPTVSLMW